MLEDFAVKKFFFTIRKMDILAVVFIFDVQANGGDPSVVS